MNRPTRDLMVLFKQELMSPQAIERQVEMLHDLLFTVENIENIITAHEIIDLNKFRLINKKKQLRNLLNSRNLKPFVFVNNKN
jgi:hypothetical protein